MKTTFPGHFLPVNHDQDFWTKATVMFDASALLDTYSFSVQTRDRFYDILMSLNDRLWIPYQFALDFLRNRRSVIHKQITRYKSVKANFSNFRKPVSELSDDLGADHFLRTELSVPLEALYKSKESEVQAQLRALESMFDFDPWLEKISALFESRVGPVLTIDDYRRLVEEAKFRFSLNMPPGWKDLAKEEQGRTSYGDYFGWSQILEHGKDRKQPALLVIDDSKEDWWEKDPGTKKLRGARPELVNEYRILSACDFRITRIESFMIHAGDALGKPIPQEVKEELKAHEQATSPDRIEKTSSVKRKEPSRTKIDDPEKPSREITDSTAAIKGTRGE